MRLKGISVVMTLALILLISSVAAFSDTISDPTAGTIRAKLAPVGIPGYPPVDPDAHGNVIINYVKGQDRFEIQANVVKLDPGAAYAVFVYLPHTTGQELGIFTTDQNGNGHLHVTWTGDIQSFDRVNIRTPVSGDTAVLTSLEAYGGSLRQSPSKRSK